MTLAWPTDATSAAAWRFWLLPSRWLHASRLAEWQLEADSSPARHRLASQAWLAGRGDEPAPEMPPLAWALALWPAERCAALWRGLALAALAPRIRHAIVQADARAVAQAVTPDELSALRHEPAPPVVPDLVPLAARLAALPQLGQQLWLQAAGSPARDGDGWLARLLLRLPVTAEAAAPLPHHPPLDAATVAAQLDRLDPAWRSSCPASPIR